MSYLISKLILFYQKGISPLFKPCCRYSPTCSQYALDCIKLHGAIIGIILTSLRILRCNPFSKGGYDPVPNKNFYKNGLW